MREEKLSRALSPAIRNIIGWRAWDDDFTAIEPDMTRSLKSLEQAADNLTRGAQFRCQRLMGDLHRALAMFAH